MKNGPRGGGRDRDRIIRHTIRDESEDFAKRVGVRIPEDEGRSRPTACAPIARITVAAIRAYNAGAVRAAHASWTLPFPHRHTCFHMLDHTWEMADKDLTGA